MMRKIPLLLTAILLVLLASCKTQPPQINITPIQEAGPNITNVSNETSPEALTNETTLRESNVTNITQPTAEMKNETPAGPQIYVVKIQTQAFSPSELAINKGDTVVWTHEDSQNRYHMVVARSYKFKSRTLTLGQSYNYTFIESGEFIYSDPLYSEKIEAEYKNQTNATSNQSYLEIIEVPSDVSMQGKIIVK